MILPYSTSEGYVALGLAYNPFIAEQEPGVAHRLWLSRSDEPLPPQSAQRQLIQLIGPKGAGKTSLLLRWRQSQAGPYHYIPLGIGRWCPPPLARLVYWDEYDRLPLALRIFSLLRAAAIGATVVVGSHVDHSHEARLCQMRVDSYMFGNITTELVQRWALQRIEAATLPGQLAQLRLDSETARIIAIQAGASWRDAGVLLHIWAAQQAKIAQI